MDSIEREYVLVNSHFASMETLTEEVTSLQESSFGRACGFPPMRSHQHMPVTSYAKEMSTGSVGGMENISRSGLESLMAPASLNILRDVQRLSVLRPSTMLQYLKPRGLADTLCGSPLYMALEIIQNQKYDAKADLWSVGAIMFQLVTSRPPFGGNNQIEVFKNSVALFYIVHLTNFSLADYPICTPKALYL
ncbi:hypothetical protein Dimus_017946 [Dionaea muscipula]